MRCERRYLSYLNEPNNFTISFTLSPSHNFHILYILFLVSSLLLFNYNDDDAIYDEEELDNDEDLDQLFKGFFDPSISLAGDANEVYFGDEVVDVEVSSSGEAGEEVILDAGGCNKTNPYCDTLDECIPSATHEACIELAPLDHCESNGLHFPTETCPDGKGEGVKKDYCGPRHTGDPRVFGPPIWKLLHTISMHYNPNGNAAHIHECENFIDGFAPMIPCKHCAWHYNQFLLGSKNPFNSRLDKNKNEWDWENRGSPCKDAKNLQQFFVDAHNNVGQHVQILLNTTKTSENTRPLFHVTDLEGLYGNVFDPLKNKYVSSDEPEIFHPILLEAINLIAMSHGVDLNKEKLYTPLESIKFECEKFLTHLPFMINHPELAIHDVTTACQSNSAMLDWVKDFERTISNGKLAILSLEDRKKRYQTRHVCTHNKFWINYPMRREIKKDVSDSICDGDSFSETR